MNSRLNFIDFSKGLGIILVVYGHVMRGLESAGMGLNHSFFKISDVLIYGFHMPLFFFLSGFFAEKWASKDMKAAFSNKFRVIAYPYFVWSLFLGIFNVLLSHYTNNSFAWADLKDIIYKPIGPFWFLYALFFIFIIYYFLRRITDLTPVFFISLVAYFISPFIGVGIIGKIFGNFIFFTSGALFATKINYVNLLAGLAKFKYASAVFGAFILFNLLYIFYYNNLGESGLNLVQLPAAFIGILFIMSLSLQIEKIKKFDFIKYFGLLSVVIYASHIFFTAFTRIVLAKLLHINNPEVHIIVGTLVGIIFPVIFYLIIKKLNLIHCFFGKEAV